jgi:glycosyltransferase involved in cell wall biosynthesis
LDKVDYYITLSPSFIPELEFFGIDTEKNSKKLLAIPNMFPPVAEIKQSKRNVILYVGRLEKMQKRIDLLADIYKRLHSALIDWEFWVVGDGPDKKDFEGFCKTNSLDRVKFFGYQRPNSFYQEAKILAFTSANEGFGNVLIEAQQYGVVPVMFNSYSAAPDLVKDGLTGELIEPFKVDEYTDEVMKLSQNTELLVRYAREARIHARKFEYEAICKRWFDLLDNIKD